MENRVRTEIYKGKKIIFLDYTKVDRHVEDKFMKVLQQAREFIMRAGKDLLILVDVRDSYATTKMIAKMKEDGKAERPFVKKSAVVGITGMKEIFLKGINLFTQQGIQPFNTIEEAKEWLVKD